MFIVLPSTGFDVTLSLSQKR